jgi:hypothetical protein
VVTEESNKGHFAVRNTSPITLNVKWYIYVPKSYKGLKNEPFVQAYLCVQFWALVMFIQISEQQLCCLHFHATFFPTKFFGSSFSQMCPSTWQNHSVLLFHNYVLLFKFSFYHWMLVSSDYYCCCCIFGTITLWLRTAGHFNTVVVLNL